MLTEGYPLIPCGFSSVPGHQEEMQSAFPYSRCPSTLSRALTVGGLRHIFIFRANEFCFEIEIVQDVRHRGICTNEFREFRDVDLSRE